MYIELYRGVETWMWCNECSS